MADASHSGNETTPFRRDIGYALSWIKEQLMLLKDQDRNLTETFLDIQCEIIRIRNGLYDEEIFSASDSHLNFESDTNVNGDIFREIYLNSSLPSGTEHLREFRTRSLSVLQEGSHVLLSLTPVKTSTQSKSEEYF